MNESPLLSAFCEQASMHHDPPRAWMTARGVRGPPRSEPSRRRHQERERHDTSAAIHQSEISSASKSKKGPSSKLFQPIAVAAIVVLSTCGSICRCDIKSTPAVGTTLRPTPLIKLPRSVDNVIANHKEYLLSYLSDKIERAKPTRAFAAHQRPSKFDSGDDLVGEELVALSNAPNKAAPAHSNTTTRPVSGANQQARIQALAHAPTADQGHHQASREKATDSQTAKKADDGLRQIMQMHDHGLSKSAWPPRHGQLPVRPTAAEEESHETTSQTRTKKWHESLPLTPARVVSSLMKSPNKMVSQVLSYVSPTLSLGTKLSSSEPLAAAQTSVNTTKSWIQYPFTPRSHSGQTSGYNTYQTLGAIPTSGASPSMSSSAPVDQMPFLYWPLFAKNTLQQMSPLSFSLKPLESATNLLKKQQHKTKPLSATTSDKSSSGSSSSGGGSNNQPVDDLIADSSSPQASVTDNQRAVRAHNSEPNNPQDTSKPVFARPGTVWSKNAANWILNSANQLAQSSLRDILTLSQLPLWNSPNQQISTAPSIYEPKIKPNKHSHEAPSEGQRRRQSLDELYRLAQLVKASLSGQTKDPIKMLPGAQHSGFNQRSMRQLFSEANQKQLLRYVRNMKALISVNSKNNGPKNQIQPRGVIWDMASDPSLAVTMFHLIERASVALPLGFLLMPIVRMIRNPLNGISLSRILPPRAAHRSVDYEELAKRLDVVDKMLSRALRSTHRESFLGRK